MLVPAWGKLSKEFPDWELLIVGPDEGGYQATVEKMIAESGCGAVVLMAPFVGPDADAWRPVRESLQDAGIREMECRRAWDQRLFPGARAGFFPFWHKARPIVRLRHR